MTPTLKEQKYFRERPRDEDEACTAKNAAV